MTPPPLPPEGTRCDYALRQVASRSSRCNGDPPSTATIRGRLDENLEKDKILARMPHSLRTLGTTLESNVEDFQRLLDDRTPSKDKEELRERLRLRRRKTVTLVEEAPIRTQESPAADEEAGAGS
ncbi:MAG: hypothetical protein U0792_04765 [Gemmataceae bacterium]